MGPNLFTSSCVHESSINRLEGTVHDETEPIIEGKTDSPVFEKT
jgi:hypothetical protein